MPLIDQQKAIDKFKPWLKVKGYSEGELNMLRAVIYELEHMSPAPQMTLTEDDLETIRIHMSAHKEDLCNQSRYGEATYYQKLIEKFLSSNVIRCKDCKHHWTHRCMDSMPREICDLNQTFYDADYDFCSLAEKRDEE